MRRFSVSVGGISFRYRSVSVSGLAALAIVLLFLPVIAEAKCSRRVGDALIAGPQGRFQCAKPKSMISYLHNNLVTPYSYSCAEKLRNTCKTEGCENPANAEEELRCQGRYVSVLNSCVKELDGAAVMAKCKDSQTWAVRAVEPGEMAGTRMASITHAKPASSAGVVTTPSDSTLSTATENKTATETATSTATAPLTTAPLLPTPPAAASPPLEFYGPPSAAAPVPQAKPSAVPPVSGTPSAATARTPSSSVEIVSRAPGIRRKSDRIRVRRVRPRT